MQCSRDTVIRLDFIVKWHVFIQISLDIALSLKLLVDWKVFIKNLFEDERRKGKFSSVDRQGQ